jgi:hypothetical protein
VFYAISQVSESSGRWDVFLGGVLLVAVVILAPDGLAAVLGRRRQAIVARWRSTVRATTPDTQIDQDRIVL